MGEGHLAAEDGFLEEVIKQKVLQVGVLVKGLLDVAKKDTVKVKQRENLLLSSEGFHTTSSFFKCTILFIFFFATSNLNLKVCPTSPSDDAAPSPHECNASVVQLPVVYLIAASLSSMKPCA